MLENFHKLTNSNVIKFTTKPKEYFGIYETHSFTTKDYKPHLKELAFFYQDPTDHATLVL